MRGLRLTLLCSLGFALLGAIGGAALHYPDMKRAAALALIGIFLGSIAAPYFESNYFAYPRTHQTVSGALAGLSIGYVGPGTILAMIIGLFVGALIGLLAPIWIERISFP